MCKIGGSLIELRLFTKRVQLLLLHEPVGYSTWGGLEESVADHCMKSFLQYHNLTLVALTGDPVVNLINDQQPHVTILL